jgi:Fe-S cluster assembly ATP-binding protein
VLALLWEVFMRVNIKNNIIFTWQKLIRRMYYTRKLESSIITGLKNNPVTAIIGPRQCGKSTLANTIAGHPKYKITKGQILLEGRDITEMSPDKRAAAGLFLSFQYPVEIEGVTLSNFLRTAYNSINGDNKKSLSEFNKYLKEKMKELDMDSSFSKRYLNKGFSGGEKKRAEILQMSVLRPKMIMLDETDSGLDIDALKIVGEGVTKLKNRERSFLVITHYERILKYITPDFVHIISDGQIVKSGGAELAKQIEDFGFNSY